MSTTQTDLHKINSKNYHVIYIKYKCVKEWSSNTSPPSPPQKSLSVSSDAVDSSVLLQCLLILLPPSTPLFSLIQHIYIQIFLKLLTYFPFFFFCIWSNDPSHQSTHVPDAKLSIEPSPHFFPVRFVFKFRSHSRASLRRSSAAWSRRGTCCPAENMTGGTYDTVCGTERESSTVYKWNRFFFQCIFSSQLPFFGTSA